MPHPLEPVEGVEVHASRLAFSGSIDYDDALAYGEQVTIIVQGTVSRVGVGTFQAVPHRLHAIAVADAYVVAEVPDSLTDLVFELRSQALDAEKARKARLAALKADAEPTAKLPGVDDDDVIPIARDTDDADAAAADADSDSDEAWEASARTPDPLG